jgi:hypothetical protein
MNTLRDRLSLHSTAVIEFNRSGKILAFIVDACSSQDARLVQDG